MTMKVSYHIDAPVKTVFDYFMDPANDAGAPGYEVLEAKMTKEGVGTYVNWRIKIAGVPGPQGFEVVTGYQPNKHITEKSSSAIVGNWDYSFEREGTGTKVTLEHRSRALWGVPPLRNMIDFGTTRMSRLYIDRVKARLETQPVVEKPKPAPRTRKAAS